MVHDDIIEGVTHPVIIIKANRGALENNSDMKFGNYDDFHQVILHNIHMDFLDLS